MSIILDLLERYGKYLVPVIITAAICGLFVYRGHQIEALKAENSDLTQTNTALRQATDALIKDKDDQAAVNEAVALDETENEKTSNNLKEKINESTDEDNGPVAPVLCSTIAGVYGKSAAACGRRGKTAGSGTPVQGPAAVSRR